LYFTKNSVLSFDLKGIGLESLEVVQVKVQRYISPSREVGICFRSTQITSPGIVELYIRRLLCSVEVKFFFLNDVLDLVFFLELDLGKVIFVLFKGVFVILATAQ
jgi:hypothetical protein